MKNKCVLLYCIIFASFVSTSIECSQSSKKSKEDIKVLVLIIASDDYPVYGELQKIWRSYMHYNPKQIKAYFMKADPNLTTMNLIADDIIWTKTSETLVPGIINKTIQSMEVLLPVIKTEFDYVLRTNLSSFYVFDRLLTFLENMPRENVYCGSPFGYTNGVSGCGYILSSDMVELLVENKSFFNDQLAPDDILIADFFYSKNIFARYHDRMDLMPMSIWNDNKNFIPLNAFHFRVKNEPSLRLTDDIYVHSQLLKMFYLPFLEELPIDLKG